MSNLSNSASDNTKYRILFDMDGTLLDLAFDHYIWMQQVPILWAANNQKSLDVSKQHLYQFYIENQGQLHWYSSMYWKNKLGIDVLSLQISNQDRIKPRPYCFDLLKQLKQEGFECWLVTNADLATLKLKLEKIELSPYFSHIISSESIGYPKEQQKFWENLQAQYPFNPEYAYFIDDNYDVLHSAKQFGIANLFSISEPDSFHPREVQDQQFLHLDKLTDLLNHLPQEKEFYGT